jgi:hypothetical protein
MKLSFATFLILFLAGLCLARQASANQARQPSREEARAIVEAICPGDGQARGATLNGCGSCPDFTGTPGPAMNNRLGNILFGSFTKPGTVELVVEFLNCELGLNDERGSVLLQKSRSGWRRIGYAPGLGGLASTYKLKDGRDLILASAVKSWMGEITSSVGVYDFTATPERRWLLLISVVDTTPQFCDSKTVTAAWIEKMEVEALNRDGAPDLRISVRSSTEPGSMLRRQVLRN